MPGRGFHICRPKPIAKQFCQWIASTAAAQTTQPLDTDKRSSCDSFTLGERNISYSTYSEWTIQILMNIAAVHVVRHLQLPITRTHHIQASFLNSITLLCIMTRMTRQLLADSLETSIDAQQPPVVRPLSSYSNPHAFLHASIVFCSSEQIFTHSG